MPLLAKRQLLSLLLACEADVAEPPSASLCCSFVTTTSRCHLLLFIYVFTGLAKLFSLSFVDLHLLSLCCKFNKTMLAFCLLAA